MQHEKCNYFLLVLFHERFWLKQKGISAKNVVFSMGHSNEKVCEIIALSNSLGFN
jgi:hypothetical protein